VDGAEEAELDKRRREEVERLGKQRSGGGRQPKGGRQAGSPYCTTGALFLVSHSGEFGGDRR
jgi:hypothetical protein